MFRSVLVANRGEIAVRIIATLRSLGVRAIAVYSDADTGALHVQRADVAVRLGAAPPVESYLNQERVLAAVAATGAEAVHPGYGFLSEKAEFARRLNAVGVAFIGPPAAAIEAMGDKINAKALVAAAGVPVVPGTNAAGLTDEELVAAADEIGFPVLVKPSAGGGGKGMHRVGEAHQLAAAIATARREARGAFGDDTLLVEKWVTRPRHIEIQVFADLHGRVVHLGERECSLQRRHQKIIEESPSPMLDANRRARMGASAVEAARAVGYVGAGTVEFIVSADAPEDYWFMEMNTRLQVEHPVTEAVTGIDLVEWQLRVAAGEPLPPDADAVPAVGGHAIEARVYAEDPAKYFLPAAGTVLSVRQPELDGVRIDTSLYPGLVVGTTYDPMLAKVIAWGADRPTAVARLDTALGHMSVLGITTNVGFLRDLLSDPDVRAGNLDTGLVERFLADRPTDSVPDEVLMAASLQATAALAQEGPSVDPWDLTGGWRLGAPAETIWSWRTDDEVIDVGVRGSLADAMVRVGEADARRVSASVSGDELKMTLGGVTSRWRWANDGDDCWLGLDGQAWRCRRYQPERSAAAGAAGRGGPVTSPMPGTVTLVAVSPGDHVTVGQTLVVVEAMKMEHQVTATLAGTVTEVPVHAGQQVALDQRLAVVEPAPTSDTVASGGSA